MSEKGTKTKPDVVTGDIQDVLKQLGNGQVLYDLTSELNNIVRAIREYPMASGTITLKIVISPFKKGDGNRVTADGKVTASVPRKPHETKIFYTTERGDVVRDNPRQLDAYDQMTAGVEK